MARRATKKQRGFDVYAFKRKIRNFTPKQKEAWTKGIEQAAQENELNLWKVREEDFWKFIYILKCNEFYKIGITSSIEDRLNQIRSGNPYEVSFVWAKKHKESENIEKEIHLFLQHKNVKREWFLLEDEDIKNIKDFIENYGNNKS